MTEIDLFSQVKDRINRNLLRSIACLFVVMVTLYGLSVHLTHGVDWTPLDVPIELTRGEQLSRKFKAQADVSHDLQLDTELRLPFEEQKCLLGIETLVPETGLSTPSGLGILWAVQSDGRIVASGNSKDTQAGYWGPTIGKILGSFPAERGIAYTVKVTVEQASPRLRSTNPKLQVAVDPLIVEGTYVCASLTRIAATFAALFAGTLLLIVGARSFCLRRRNKTLGSRSGLHG